MANPHSFENSLRIHDKAFFDWLGNLRVDYGDPSTLHPDFPQVASYPTKNNFPILRTMATRQRAFATIVDLLVHLQWIDTGTADQIRQNADDFAVLPLPVATIERGDPVPDPITASVPKRFNRSRFNEVTGKWEGHPWPAAYLLPYTVTFWSIKRYTEVFMREWLYSQLGALGAGDSEVFLNVEHDAPWGTQLQALSLEATADQSDLEGDNPRYIRYEASFQMRMLHMRPLNPADVHDPISAVNTPTTFLRSGDGVTEDPCARTPDIECAPPISGNLFTHYYDLPADIASKWPKAGNATVTQSPIAPAGGSVASTLEIAVRTTTDRVGLAEKPVLVPTAPNNRALLSFSMRYRATAESALVLHQKDGTTPANWSELHRVVLPAATEWTTFQVFTLADQQIVSAIIEGRAISSTLQVTDIDMRHAFNGSTLEPQGSSTGFGGGTKQTWSGLTRHQSYLLVVVPDTYTGSWSMRTQDDDVAPDNILTRNFDTAVERGFVEIIQPKESSVAITVPAGFPSATFLLQPYIGGFLGRLLAA